MRRAEGVERRASAHTRRGGAGGKRVVADEAPGGKGARHENLPGLPIEPLGDAIVILISVLVASIAVVDGLSRRDGQSPIAASPKRLPIPRGRLSAFTTAGTHWDLLAD